jgi:hypothetical protein
MNTSRANRLVQWLRRIGPYSLLVLLMPGGAVLALLLWAHQHYRKEI